MKKLLYVFILLSTIGGYSGQTWTAEDSAFTERELDSQFRKSIGELSSLSQPSVGLITTHQQTIKSIITNSTFNANLTDEHNRTPLMLALKHLEADNPDTRSSLGSVIWQLIDQTDNINAAEIRTGSTALHIAIESLKKGRINPEVISQLVKRPQIDLLQKNSTGQTPYKLAKEQIIASAVVDFLFQWNYYQKSTKASKHKSEVINILREQTNASEEIIQLIGEYACKTYPITTPPKNINPHLS